jgi:hypothetical protein
MRVCLAIALGWVYGATVLAQVSAPSPSQPPLRRPTYDSLDAGQDAYRAAEADREAAIQRQLQTQDEIRWYNTWGPDYNFWPPPPSISPYNAPWGYPRAYRGGFHGPPPWAWRDAYKPGYPDGVRQPTGHEKIWTSPNGYIYRPLYDQPDRPQRRSASPVPPAASRLHSDGSPPSRSSPTPPPPTPMPPPPADSGGPREL